MDAQELQDPEKASRIWVKYLYKIGNKMNSVVSSMISMNQKDAIKLDTVPLDKTYPKETILTEGGCIDTLYESGEQHGDQNRRVAELIWSKNTYRLD